MIDLSYSYTPSDLDKRAIARAVYDGTGRRRGIALLVSIIIAIAGLIALHFMALEFAAEDVLQIVISAQLRGFMVGAVTIALMFILALRRGGQSRGVSPFGLGPVRVTLASSGMTRSAAGQVQTATWAELEAVGETHDTLVLRFHGVLLVPIPDAALPAGMTRVMLKELISAEVEAA